MGERKIECGVTSCHWNKQFDVKYGICEYEKNVILKFRAAFDGGNGTIVMLECLNMHLPQDNPDAA
jgi:hypothetical protein